MYRCSTNKEAWEKIFNEYDVLNKIQEQGFFEISSKEINEYREARLMTKFDNSESIPKILSENNLSILPISGNKYMIARFKAYKKFGNEPKDIERVEFPPYIESLDYNNISSEALALNCTYITGILEDFLVRQLYYPYRLWKSKITKKVRPIYVVYSNGIFTIYEYRFNDINEYSSIELVKCQKYSIEDTNIDLGTIQNLIENIQNYVEEPKTSFPQANSFERVINLCELLENSEKGKKEITEKYEFDPRQTNYYTDAAIYLGLVVKKGIRDKSFELSELGKKVFSLNYKSRQIEFAKLILSHKVFHMTIKKYFQKLEMPTDSEIVEIMKECELYKIGKDSTFYRRASTIKSWIDWIINLITEY